MDLLPKSQKDFSSKQYWNTFFTNRGSKSFEWYGEYVELCSIIHKYIRPSDKILVAGCGNSTLSVSLYKDGYKDITNIDISEIVIKQMTKKYKDCNDMKWLIGDLTALQFNDAHYSCVLDKGTLDALMTDDSQDVITTINKFFSEIGRVLRVGGRYICISLLQEHILKHIVNWFPNNGWMLRICRCEDAENSQAESGNFSFPVFVIVCTKFKQMENFKPVIEKALHGETAERVSDPNELLSDVKALQHFALLRHNLHNQRVAGDAMSVELIDPKSNTPRYILHIIDAPKKTNKLKFAVFIVPHGREVEWLFGTESGRIQLSENAGANRLIVIHLRRDQQYESLSQIQDELSAKVLELAPSKLPSNYKVPFLSVGDELGSRQERMRSVSKYSGDYIVEDLDPPGGTRLRRLIFLNNQAVVQSEAKLLQVNKKKKKGKSINNVNNVYIDTSYLACDHHLAIVSSLGLVTDTAKVLLVGLGGGPLATYIHKYFPKVQLTVVDIDSAMVEVAQQWFGFTPDNRMKVLVDDGLDVITRASETGELYDIIIFDVDSKDTNIGMSCPPPDFVEKTFLDKVATCLNTKGVFVLNLVCRDKDLRNSVIEDIKSVFSAVLKQLIPQEVNQVLYCRVLPNLESKSFINEYELGLIKVNSDLKLSQKVNNVIDVSETMTNVEFL